MDNDGWKYLSDGEKPVPMVMCEVAVFFRESKTAGVRHGFMDQRGRFLSPKGMTFNGKVYAFRETIAPPVRM